MTKRQAENRDATEERYDIVDAQILRLFPNLVTELGGDPPALLRQVGIDPEHFVWGRSRASYRQVVELMELAAGQLECHDFGMRLAKALQTDGIDSPLVLVMQNSTTFGEALEFVVRHNYAHSLAASIWLKRPESGDTVIVGHDILLDHLPNRCQVMELILLLAHLAAFDVTGGLARARRVFFRHQPVSTPRVYRRYFGCDVRFGQRIDGIVFHDCDLARPVVTPDARVYEKAIAFIDRQFSQHRPPLHAQVRGVVMRFLGTQHCTNERVARELRLHSRTLHRRLGAEGTSFQRIKHEVRSDLMLYYLQQTDLDFAHISGRLGFAEQSAMTRYCNQWFSVSPTRLRSRRHDGAQG